MATIIDAFLVTLGLDSKDYHAKMEEAQHDQKKLAAEVKETEKKLHESAENGKEFFASLKEHALEFFGVMASIGAILSFTEHMVKAEVATLRLSKALNLDIEELQKWQGAVTLVGGSAEAFNASIKALGGSLVDIEKSLPRSERAVKVLNAVMGAGYINKGQHKDTLQVLDDLSGRMEKMGAMEAIRLGGRIGLDDATIRLLRKGKEGIEELRHEAAELGLYTKEDAEAAEQLEEAQHKLGLSGAAFGRQIMTMIMPALQAMANGMLKIGKWMQENQQLVKAGLIGIAAGLVAMGVAAYFAAPPIIAALSPVYLIALAVAVLAAGIAYLWMEWQKWASGGKSSLAPLFQYLFDMWQQIKDVVLTLFSTLKEALMTYINLWIDAWNMVVAIFDGDANKIDKAFKALWDDLIVFFKYVLSVLLFNWSFCFHSLLNIVEMVFGKIKDAAMKPLREIWEQLKQIGEAFKEMFAPEIASTKLMVNTIKRVYAVDPKLLEGNAPNAGMSMRPSIGGNTNVTSYHARLAGTKSPHWTS